MRSFQIVKTVLKSKLQPSPLEGLIGFIRQFIEWGGISSSKYRVRPGAMQSRSFFLV